MNRQYQRHLPHQVPERTPIFLTWNLKGAMPKEIIDSVRREQELLHQQPHRPGESASDRNLRIDKMLFAIADRSLDLAQAGPLHLKDHAAAGIVEEAILFGSPQRYDLFAWCVMANHVHLLVTPRRELAVITQGLKGFTAYQINQLQETPGRVFWQDESYDHWTRDENELFRIIEYIENNPVAAGLCVNQTDWPWSSARFRSNWPRGTAYSP